MEVWERLRAAIGEDGQPNRLGQSEVARRIGEKRDWVNRRVTGNTSLQVADLERMARVLGMSPAAFFDDVDENGRTALPAAFKRAFAPDDLAQGSEPPDYAEQAFRVTLSRAMQGLPPHERQTAEMLLGVLGHVLEGAA